MAGMQADPNRIGHTKPGFDRHIAWWKNPETRMGCARDGPSANSIPLFGPGVVRAPWFMHSAFPEAWLQKQNGQVGQKFRHFPRRAMPVWFFLFLTLSRRRMNASHGAAGTYLSVVGSGVVGQDKLGAGAIKWPGAFFCRKTRGGQNVRRPES